MGVDGKLKVFLKMMFFIKFYKLPITIFLGLLLINIAMIIFVKKIPADNPILLNIGTQASRFNELIFFGSLLVTSISYLFTTWELYRWGNGKTEDCYSCGGIVDHKDGRYGFYYKCRICSKTRS